MDEVQCDLITVVAKRASSSHDFKYILTVKDCFSKFCWLTPLTSKEGLPIAKFLCNIFHEHGPPQCLHSDNGSEFVNRFVKHVCAKYNVKIAHGRPYHPQSQGQIENLNRRVKNCLRYFLLEYSDTERAEVWPRIIASKPFLASYHKEYTIFCVLWKDSVTKRRKGCTTTA